MRIAIFSDFSLAQVTGISDMLRTMMRGLTERGHAVCFLAPSSPTPTDDSGPWQLIALRSIGAPGAPAFRFTLPFGVPAALRTFRPDVLHTNAYGSVGFRALWCARRLNVPIVGTEHTLPAEYLHYMHLNYDWAKEMMKKFAAHYYQRCELVTAPSRIVVEELRAYGVRREIRLISNPIETDVFRPRTDKEQLKKKFGIRKSAVLCFGRLDKEKNIDELLEAFALVREQGTDAELVLIGDGQERKHLERKTHDLGIADVTRFLGLLRGEALVEAINATDVCVITSRSETQSLTTLQAMACGLPVVAVNRGALPEYVSHDVTGFIVESGNQSALADRMTELLTHPQMREEFGKRGRASAERFGPATILDQMEQIYASVLQKHTVIQ